MEIVMKGELIFKKEEGNKGETLYITAHKTIGPGVEFLGTENGEIYYLVALFPAGVKILKQELFCRHPNEDRPIYDYKDVTDQIFDVILSYDGWCGWFRYI